MTIAHVQSTRTADSANSTSLAFGYASANTAGNLLVLAVGNDNNTAPSSGVSTITDSQGNTWSFAAKSVVSGFATSIECWYAANCKAGTNTVTVHWSSAATTKRLAILEYSGALTASPLDVTNASTQTSSNPSASITPNSSGCLIFGAVYADSSTQAWTPGSGYTERTEDADATVQHMQTEDQIQASGTPSSVTRTHNTLFAPVFTNSASTTVAYASAVASGQLLTCILTLGSSAASVSTITDSVNAAGAWQLARKHTGGAGTSFATEIWYAPNSAAGTPTVTVTLTSTAAGTMQCGIHAWKSISTASATVLQSVNSTTAVSSLHGTGGGLSSLSTGFLVMAAWRSITAYSSAVQPAGYSSLAPDAQSRGHARYIITNSTGENPIWQVGASTTATGVIVSFQNDSSAVTFSTTVSWSGAASADVQWVVAVFKPAVSGGAAASAYRDQFTMLGMT